MEISPVEKSLVDISYIVDVVITEKRTPGDDKKGKKKDKKKSKKDAASPMGSVFGVSGASPGDNSN